MEKIRSCDTTLVLNKISHSFEFFLRHVNVLSPVVSDPQQPVLSFKLLNPAHYILCQHFEFGSNILKHDNFAPLNEINHPLAPLLSILVLLAVLAHFLDLHQSFPLVKFRLLLARLLFLSPLLLCLDLAVSLLTPPLSLRILGILVRFRLVALLALLGHGLPLLAPLLHLFLSGYFFSAHARTGITIDAISILVIVLCPLLESFFLLLLLFLFYLFRVALPLVLCGSTIA